MGVLLIMAPTFIIQIVGRIAKAHAGLHYTVRSVTLRCLFNNRCYRNEPQEVELCCIAKV